MPHACEPRNVRLAQPTYARRNRASTAVRTEARLIVSVSVASGWLVGSSFTCRASEAASLPHRDLAPLNLFHLDQLSVLGKIDRDKSVGMHDATRLATLHNSAMPGPLTPTAQSHISKLALGKIGPTPPRPICFRSRPLPSLVLSDVHHDVPRGVLAGRPGRPLGHCPAAERPLHGLRQG